MKTTYIINRSGQNTIGVKTKHDDAMTSLYGHYDATAKNMGGTIGSWSGDYPTRADDIVKAGMAIAAGETTELIYGEAEKDEQRTYPYDPIKAAEWDKLHNDGGEGYNPYR